jgi:hypothetical protein
MDNAIIVALIGLLGSATGSFVGAVINSKLTAYRLEQLEKKVDLHNNAVERLYLVERHNAVVDEEIKVVNHRINDLEQFHKP